MGKLQKTMQLLLVRGSGPLLDSSHLLEVHLWMSHKHHKPEKLDSGLVVLHLQE